MTGEQKEHPSYGKQLRGESAGLKVWQSVWRRRQKLGEWTSIFSQSKKTCRRRKAMDLWWLTLQGSFNYPFGGIKQCKCMIILRDFSYNSALFGLVTKNDPCIQGKSFRNQTRRKVLSRPKLVPMTDPWDERYIFTYLNPPFGCQPEKVCFWWFFGAQISDPAGGFRYEFTKISIKINHRMQVNIYYITWWNGVCFCLQRDVEESMHRFKDLFVGGFGGIQPEDIWWQCTILHAFHRAFLEKFSGFLTCGILGISFWICLRWVFTFYHGKPPLNHHLGNIFHFSVHHGQANLSIEYLEIC